MGLYYLVGDYNKKHDIRIPNKKLAISQNNQVFISNVSYRTFSFQRDINSPSGQDSSALIIRFSDPAKPQFRMVNRARGSVAFRQVRGDGVVVETGRGLVR